MRFQIRNARLTRVDRATRRARTGHVAGDVDFELAVRQAEPAVRDELYAAARRSGIQHL